MMEGEENMDIRKRMIEAARLFYGPNITPCVGKTWCQSFWPIAESGKLLLCFNLESQTTKSVSYDVNKKIIVIHG